MLIKVKSVAFKGVQTVGIDVEVNIANRGLPSFDIVGLPNKAVAESRQRVRTAIINSGFEFPIKKIMVNLAPADITKEGSFYDLPIAVGLLSYIGKFAVSAKNLFFGELSLNGNLRHTKGSLLAAVHALDNEFGSLFIPQECIKETLISSALNVFGVNNLLEIYHHFNNSIPISVSVFKNKQHKLVGSRKHTDFREILDQPVAKRALEIAAAGGHNVLMIGPPGIGKSMLSNAMVSILPDLNMQESIEVTKIYSYASLIGPNQGLILQRKLRAPHHTITYVGLVGGGSNVRPGEISLAHRGILFLDELSEFPRKTLESLRQPMEDGFITITRGVGSVTFPSRFTLIAASNPCPCGFYGHPSKECACTDRQKENYTKKLSGPILDRIDMIVRVSPVSISKLGDLNVNTEESSKYIRKRVVSARKLQLKRFRKIEILTNSEILPKYINEFCKLNENSKFMLNRAAEKLSVSARAYFKIIKVARTIADLENSEIVLQDHIAEALQYRQSII